MTRKSRFISALAVVVAGALMITTTAYQSRAADGIMNGNYHIDEGTGYAGSEVAEVTGLNTTSTGTFRYDAPGTDGDIEIASSDIKSLENAVKALSTQVMGLGDTAKAADMALDTSAATAITNASTANSTSLADIKASVDTLNATLESKEFGRDTTVMVHQTSVGNVDLSQASVYEAMTMSATGLPTFSKPEASLYAVYALGDNPAVDLTTATPLGLYSSCSGGNTSAFSLTYFPRGAYDKDTAVTLTLPANGSNANAYNVGKPYFFALARIAAEDRETKFGKVQVAKAEKCNFASLPAKCGSAENIEDAKYVFWFGTDISGEPAGIWKGTIATNDTVSTSSIAGTTDTTEYTTSYVCDDVRINYSRSDKVTTATLSGNVSTSKPAKSTPSSSMTLNQYINTNNTITAGYYKVRDGHDSNGNVVYANHVCTDYLHGYGSKIFYNYTNIIPVNSTENLSGTDYIYWTNKETGETDFKRSASATVPCTCTKNYYSVVYSTGSRTSSKTDSETFKCYLASLACSYVDNTYSGYYSPSLSTSDRVTLTDEPGPTYTKTINVNTTNQTVMFAPLVKE